MPRRGDGPQQPATTNNRAELARLAGVNRSTITEWSKLEGWPEGPDGSVCIRDFFLWRFRLDGLVRDQREQPAGSLDQRQKLADVRKAEADAALKETKVRQLLSELVSRSAVKSELATLFHTLRHRLQAMPAEVVTSLDPAIRHDVQLDLAQKIELVLREMSAWQQSRQQFAPAAPKTADSKPADSPAATGGTGRKTRKGSGTPAKRSSRTKSRGGSRGPSKT